MSRSSPNIQNPASRFFEYKNSSGNLEYYDRDKQERITQPYPFTFLVLDELSTITGYERSQKASYYSNEVKNSKKEPFTIKLKGQQVYQGLYKNEQNVVQVPRAAKFTKSIYVAFKEGDNWLIGNIKFSGSAMGSWIEFTKNNRVQDSGKIILTRGELVEDASDDKFNHYPPAMKYVDATKEEDTMAVNLDKVLQSYLAQYFTAAQGDDEDEPTDTSEPSGDTFNTDNGKASAEQIADFERRKAAKLADKHEDEAIKEQVDDLWGGIENMQPPEVDNNGIPY